VDRFRIVTFNHTEKYKARPLLLPWCSNERNIEMITN